MGDDIGGIMNVLRGIDWVLTVLMLMLNVYVDVVHSQAAAVF